MRQVTVDLGGLPPAPPASSDRRDRRDRLARVARLLLARSVSPAWPRWAGMTATWAVITGAALVVATAAIHLNLWLEGYRHVPKLGVLFLAQAVTGLILGPLLALSRHAIFVLGLAVFMASSAGGLVLSATVGFVGIHDTLAAPWAGWALGVEIAGFVLLTAASGLLVLRR